MTGLSPGYDPQLLFAMSTMKFWLVILVTVANSWFMPLAVGQTCRCHTCEDPMSPESQQWRKYWTELRKKIDTTTGHQGPSGNLFGVAQIVFLDFDSGDNGNISYNQVRRDQIQSEMEAIYQGFDISFTQTLPRGPFSTIVFNEGSLASGSAEDIDFRNLNINDNAVLNVDGLGLLDSQIVTASANIAAHELGHLLGLRHHDIFGPIGDGVLPGFGPFYTPDYLGPDDAFESSDHVMATGGIGADLSTIVTPNWFSERSSIKLSFAEKGQAVLDTDSNDSITQAQPISFQNLIVPNTIVVGQNAGPADFSVSTVVVVGTLNGLLDGQDIFEISGKAGDRINIEVYSNLTDRLSIDPIDPNISVFDGTGNFVDYYGVDAFNETEFETAFDSIIIDLIVPKDGAYFVEVDSSSEMDAGNYELLVYRFNGVLGDVNCDGDLDLLDVAPFVEAIVSGNSNPKADINLDGIVSLLDVNPFVGLLNGS